VCSLSATQAEAIIVPSATMVTTKLIARAKLMGALHIATQQITQATGSLVSISRLVVHTAVEGTARGHQRDVHPERFLRLGIDRAMVPQEHPGWYWTGVLEPGQLSKHRTRDRSRQAIENDCLDGRRRGNVAHGQKKRERHTGDEIVRCTYRRLINQEIVKRFSIGSCGLIR
jgi:hypothetical protein